MTQEGSLGGRGRGQGGFRGRCRGGGRQNFNKDTIECWECHKLGHFQREFPSKEINFIGSQEEVLLVTWLDESDDYEEGERFLDSTCSNHMIAKKDCFLDFDDNYKDSVKLGDNLRMIVKGNSNVRLQMDGKLHIIT